MSGTVTWGQVAYEGFVAFQPDDGFVFEAWAEKDEHGDRDVMGRADWEAAGKAVTAVAAQAVQAEYDRDPQADDQYRAGLAFALERLADAHRA